MTSKPPIVITRPKKQGLQLQQALQKHAINTCCQPLLDYQQASSGDEITQILQHFNPAIIIFISVAAVEYADRALPLNLWLNSDIKVIAVGQTTQQALADRNILAICPITHDSEGMLALAALSGEQLNKNNKVLIVRGDGGRELLAVELAQRGANVRYLESYRRNWLAIPQQVLTQWQQKNVAGFIITSNALLQRVVDLLDIKDNYWQNTCLWIVASERIKQSAQQLGLQKVINSHGANDQAIINTLLNMESTDDW